MQATEIVFMFLSAWMAANLYVELGSTSKVVSAYVPPQRDVSVTEHGPIDPSEVESKEVVNMRRGVPIYRYKLRGGKTVVA